MDIRILFAALMSATVLLVACGGDGDGDTSGGSISSPPLPAEVNNIEEAAEDAIDMAFVSNWDKIAVDASSIEEDWQTFLSSSDAVAVTASQKQAMSDAVASLREANRLRDGLLARQAANNVSEVIIDVFDLFKTRIPTDVGRLDYLERQVIIDAEKDDWDAVETDITRVRQTFEEVRAEVEGAGGTGETAAFEASLEKQENLAASRSPAITEEADIALELVDDLESVF